MIDTCLSRHFGKNTKRYAYLVSENLRNFRQSKDSIVVLTRIAWAANVTSAHRVSQDLQTRTWHSWLTFSYRINLLIESIENIVSKNE